MAKEKKEAGAVKVRLLKAHIHNRDQKKKGDTIEVSEIAARWLVEIGVAERA